MTEAVLEVSPAEVRAMREAGESLRLVDVREPWEHATAAIEGSELIPMRSIPNNLGRLEGSAEPLIVYCHHGVRSLSVVDWLRGQGLSNCWSMAGGIDRWSCEIDPLVPRY
jgi:rhodanese-related sulfurtransferase